MKYKCPFCNSLMSYESEKQYFYSGNIESAIDYLIHRCRKSKCRIGVIPKYKIWESKDEVKGFSIILDDYLKTYKIVSRYDLNATSLSKLETEVSFNGSKNVLLKNIIEIRGSIKIDLADPINSGLEVINRLMKLRAFS